MNLCFVYWKFFNSFILKIIFFYYMSNHKFFLRFSVDDNKESFAYLINILGKIFNNFSVEETKIFG